MPTSPYSHIGAIVSFLIQTRPQSLLDVGLGNGKIGFIARDLLDVMFGERYRREDWKVRIDGIEVFPDYIQAHQRAIYDSIIIGDAFEAIDGLGKYDVIVLGDVLEHFQKTRAWEFLDKCASHSLKFLIICIPLGDNWTQPDIYENEYERHLSFWSHEEFVPFVFKEELFQFQHIGSYGAFLIRVGDYIHHRIMVKAECLSMAGKKHKAISYMIDALQEIPVNLSNELFLTNLLIETGMIGNAIQRLERLQILLPEESAVAEFLKKLKGVKMKAE